MKSSTKKGTASAKTKSNSPALLIATKKGAFILSSDNKRRKWAVKGPIFLGNIAHHLVLDPRDRGEGRTMLMAAKTGHLGPTIFRSTDLGETWGQITTPAETETDYIVSGVFLNKDFGYVFTDAGLVLRFENQVTRISEPNFSNTPVDFELSQNYPNPFNPTTTIAYSVSETEIVTLKVYNLRGEEVKTLVDGKVNVGKHYVDWDATDNSGQKVTSGLYLYVLKIANQKLSKSMIFLK